MKNYKICFSSNDNYAQHLGVTIYSLLKNTKKSKQISLYVADGGISKINKEKLNSIVKKFGSKIKYLKPDTSRVKDLKLCKHFGIDTYNRFFLIDTINADKLVYLDCDTVVEGDITKLFEIPFEENVLFAVEDPFTSKEKNQELGIPLKAPYFNAGLLLISSSKWKKGNYSQKAIDFMRDNPERVEFADQDGLNKVLVGKWKKIHPSWNLMTRAIYAKYFPGVKSNYSKEALNEALAHPKIIHYSSFIKPWYFIDWHPLKKRYIHYLRQTPWKDYKFPDKTPSGFIKRLKDYRKVFAQRKAHRKEVNSLKKSN